MKLCQTKLELSSVNMTHLKRPLKKCGNLFAKKPAVHLN